jgi:FkbM family methyltransferase
MAPWVFLASFFAVTALSDLVIRPSDHVLSGADYDGMSLRRVVDSSDPPILGPVNYIHQVISPVDVEMDSRYATDFWGSVDFSPVPAFNIDTHDPVTQDVLVSGSVHAKKKKAPWDLYVWDRLVSILRSVEPGRMPVMVDVGAGLGYFSLAAASLGARVIAFEPMSKHARKFSKSILNNGFQNRIMLFQNVAWADVPSVPMRLNTVGQVYDIADNDGLYGLDYVNTLSLSHVVREAVDVLKINTGNGSEGVVIAGAKRIICTFRVRHIIMEFTDVKTRTEIDDNFYSVTNMLGFLDSAGYEVSDVAKDAPPLSISDYQRFPPSVLFSLKGARPTCA